MPSFTPFCCLGWLIPIDVLEVYTTNEKPVSFVAALNETTIYRRPLSKQISEWISLQSSRPAILNVSGSSRLITNFTGTQLQQLFIRRIILVGVVILQLYCMQLRMQSLLAVHANIRICSLTLINLLQVNTVNGLRLYSIVLFPMTAVHHLLSILVCR